MILLLLTALSANAAEVPIIWTDTNNVSGRVTNYAVWLRIGTNQTQRYQLLRTTNRFTTLSNINITFSNRITVSCIGSNSLESDESNPLILPPIFAPSIPSNRNAGFTWTVPVGAILQKSFDMENWREFIRNLDNKPIIFRITEPAGNPMCFYRVFTNQSVIPPLP